MGLTCMKVTNANGAAASLIYCADGQYRIRVYKTSKKFIDYDINHNDLWFTIVDDDACFYSDGDRHWIDHSPETLGVHNAQD